MRKIFFLGWLMFCLLITSSIWSQDSLLALPGKYYSQVNDKVSSLGEKLDNKTEKLVSDLKKEEKKLIRIIGKKDSILATQIIKDLKSYQELAETLTSNPKIKYVPYLDTLLTTFKLLDQIKILNAEKYLSNLQNLQSNFSKAEVLRKLFKERKDYLKKQLQSIGLLNHLKKYNKKIYYYSEQIKEYTSLLKDKKKAERKAIDLLSKSKMFQDFMKRNSMLSSIFRMPGGDPVDPSFQASLAGLQTRVQINALIQQQITSGGPDARTIVQQNLQSAQTELEHLKNKINQLSGGSSDEEIPDFKPNSQKTKGFLQRFEYGTNFQIQKSNQFYPSTADLALSVGYKLNNKNVIGIGASYKLGLGKGWNDIKFSHQGFGARSFLDIKLKRNFIISGGYEINNRYTSYQSSIQIPDWNESGLISASRTFKVKSKFFSFSRIQLLWDFLSYKKSSTQPHFQLRAGYNFN